MNAADGELEQIRIDWFYDALGRVVGEAFDADDDSLDFIAQYKHDMVGNRVEKSADNQATAQALIDYLADGTFAPDELVDYVYDDNDRLLTEIKDDLTAALPPE